MGTETKSVQSHTHQMSLDGSPTVQTPGVPCTSLGRPVMKGEARARSTHRLHPFWRSWWPWPSGAWAWSLPGLWVRLHFKLRPQLSGLQLWAAGTRLGLSLGITPHLKAFPPLSFRWGFATSKVRPLQFYLLLFPVLQIWL